MGLRFPVMIITLAMYSFITFSLAAQDNETGYKLKTVVIDAGHGGKDPGSPGKLTYEKDVVLAIALKLGRLIESELPGYRRANRRTLLSRLRNRPGIRCALYWRHPHLDPTRASPGGCRRSCSRIRSTAACGTWSASSAGTRSCRARRQSPHVEGAGRDFGFHGAWRHSDPRGVM